MKKIVGILIVLVLGVSAFWYVNQKEVIPEVPVAEEKKPALSLETIQNMTIVSPLNDQRFAWTRGALYFKEPGDKETWEATTEETDYFTKLYTGASVAYGDLDADGISEAAFVVVSRSGGSGTFYDLAVVKNEDGRAVWVDSKMLGDRIVANVIRVENGMLFVDMFDHGPGEPLAVATAPVTKKFELRGKELFEHGVD